MTQKSKVQSSKVLRTSETMASVNAVSNDSDLVRTINKYKELEEEKKIIERDYDIDFTFDNISMI